MFVRKANKHYRNYIPNNLKSRYRFLGTACNLSKSIPQINRPVQLDEATRRDHRRSRAMQMKTAFTVLI